MKSKTSFFDLTVLKKDITRFAPLWILYSVGLSIGLLLCNTVGTAEGIADGLHSASNIMIEINLVYACISAMVLFGDLYNSRLCNALHAFPMRREGWFLTHFASGMLFSIVPTTVTMLIMLPMLKSYAFAAFAWWGVTLLTYFFCFCVASFASLCTGSRLGLGVVYALIQFASMLVKLFLTLIYEPLLYGVKLGFSLLETLCPTFYLTGSPFFSYECTEAGLEKMCMEPEAWTYLWVIAAIGLVFALLGLVLYRIRHLESAGDFIAFKPIRPLFLLGYTLSVGMFFHSFAELITGDASYVYFAIGITVGFFTGLMLLERTVKVIRKKSLITFLVGAAVLAGTMVATYSDPANLINRIPENPVSVTMSINDQCGYTTTDAEKIALMKDAHRALLNERSTYGNEISFTYKLADGTSMKRYYAMDETSAARSTVEKFASTYQCMLSADDWDSYAAAVYEIVIGPCGPSDFEYTYLEAADAQGKIRELMAALRADFDAGNIHCDFLYVPGRVEFCVLEISSGNTYRQLFITEDAVNTTAYLKTLVDLEGDGIPESVTPLYEDSVELTTENS